MLVFPNLCYSMPVHVWFILNVLVVLFEILHHLGPKIRCLEIPLHALALIGPYKEIATLVSVYFWFVSS